MLIYVAGKYTGDVDSNIEAASRVAGILWEAGHAVICPHANTAHFEKKWDVSWEQYLEGDLNMISRCDALVMVPGWKTSRGANLEHAYAEQLGIPIFYYPDIPALHKTETTSPEQCKAFREIVGQMYRTHLRKNADYSPANILATGEVGLVTRLWDKTARLMSLTGIKFKSLIHEGVALPEKPQNEAIDDTYMDLAVYAIIGVLLRKDKWGK